MLGTDVIHVPVSDFHSGSNYALFLNRFWQGGKGINHRPTGLQDKIRTQFELATTELKKAREGKQLVVVHNGDAIDGDHHASGDVCTTNEKEQADIHIELMEELKKRVGWRRGDKLYYTEGTEIHTKEWEGYIGGNVNAEQNGDGYVFDELTLKTNGVVSKFVHHGPGAGSGANEGNAVRGWLKGIYYDALKESETPPDIVYSSHVHSPTMAVFERREKMNFKLMWGIVTPSMQAKTRYARMRAPVKQNKTGIVWQEIKNDGTICIPQFRVAVT